MRCLERDGGARNPERRRLPGDSSEGLPIPLLILSIRALCAVLILTILCQITPVDGKSADKDSKIEEELEYVIGNHAEEHRDKKTCSNWWCKTGLRVCNS